MQEAEPTRELRFELLAEIAVGNTARVELCRVIDGPRQGQLCAVKRLHVHVAEDPAFLDMFRDEVWMTAALKNRHVVEVLGWGVDQRREGPWLAVELVRGVSLARLMKTVFETGEMFTERMVVFVARSVCEGLAEAHALRSGSGEHLNLVHRDLTPGNVLLGFGGEVKITDFGLAKAKQRLTRTLTGLLKGQPQYMSPEQVHNRPLDGRSDIFALGVLLFELFSGRRPWATGTELDVMRAITDQRPADLGELRPRMDRALVEVVERCLEKDPGRRYQSARELGERFDGWLNAHGYREANENSIGRFVRRNAMRQMRWFERAVAGEFAAQVQADQAAQNRLEARVEADEDSSPRQSGVDWGEEGPTLVQRSQQARQLIRQLATPGGRPRMATMEPTTQKRAAKSSPELGSESPPQGMPSLADNEDGDATMQLGERDRRAVLGVVAPHDPEVPPVPSRADRDGTKTVASQRQPELGAAVRVSDDSVTGARAIASAPASGMVAVAPPLAEMRSRSDEEFQTTQPVGRIPPPPPAPEMPLTPPHGAGLRSAITEPLPQPHEQPKSSRSPHSLQALEARPSYPPPTISSGGADFTTESRRLAAAADRAAETADRAADAASAAARAAKLADEAQNLAMRGLRSEAIERLGEAQRIDQTLAGGEVPESRPLASDRFVGTFDPSFDRRMAFVRRQLHSKRVVTIAVLAVAGVLLLVALVVAVAL